MPAHPQSTLADETNFLLRVVGDVPARIWIKNSDGRYVFVNSEVARMLDLPREKFIGATDEELFPRVGHVYWRKDQTVLSTGQPLVTTDQVEKNRYLFCLRFRLDIDGEP